MNKKKIADFLQSFLLTVLFLLLLGQCAFYIRLAENLGNARLEAFPEGELVLLGKQQNTEDTSYLITPCFTGVIPNGRIGGGCFLPLSNDGAGDEVWQYFVEILKNSVGGTAKQVIFSDTEEKESYLSQLYMGASECYYVKFLKGIEFSVLTMLLSDTYDMLPENPDFLISDMFLVNGGSGEASLVAVDKYGEILKIFPSKNISFNTEFIETYNDTDSDYFEFVRIFPLDYYDENGYFPILSKSLSLPDVTKSELASFVSLGDIGSDTDRILSVLGMNKDNTRSYITSDGDYMFVENTTRLRLGKNGDIQYNPDDEGMQVHSILEYSGNNGGSGGFGEMAMLSRAVASTVSEFLYLCDGKLSLYDISYNGKTLSFIYKYTANGIPIKDVDESGNWKNAVRLDFEGDRLVRAEINVIPYRFSGVTSTDMPQLSALALLQDKSNHTDIGSVEYFGAEYVFSEEKGTSSLVFVMKSEKEAAN